MEPTNESTRVSPSDSVAAVPPVRRGRPSRIVIAAVLTELVVIAAVCNQGVVHALRKNLDRSPDTYADYARGGIDAATTFSWRFVAQSGQPTHVWAAQFAAIGALVVLTAIGVLAVARGVVSFGRVFAAVWAVVAAVTPIAIMVRNLVNTPSTPGPEQSRVGQSVYGYPDFGAVIVAGIGLGLIVALFTAVVAVATRTKPRLAGPDEEDGEYLDSQFGARPAQRPGSNEPPPWGVEQYGDAPTGVQPRAYRSDAPPAAPWSGAPQSGETSGGYE
ncbi:MAG: hypothetical protein ABI301_02595, partial [Jatrophihabitantaceae bacterium]